MTADYYALLKIRRDATQDEVKRAYRRRAREMHPDVNPDPVTQERFKEITEAYDVLSNTDKRRMYDMGMDPFSRNGSPGGENNGGFAFNDDFFYDMAGTFGPGFFDIFSGAAQDGRDKNAQFNRATAGMTNTEKLHYAVVNRFNVQALLDAHVVPAEKTLYYIIQKKWTAPWVEAMIRNGAKPTPEMLDIAVRNDLKTCKITGTQLSGTVSLLLENDVVPLEKTVRYAVEEGHAPWVDALLKNGGRATPDMLAIAKRNKDKATIRILRAALPHGFFRRRHPAP